MKSIIDNYALFFNFIDQYIPCGFKDIENRSWATKHRGPILIHAGQKVDKNARQVLIEKGLNEYLGYFRLQDLPTSGIVGQVEIVDCVTHSDSDWFEGPVGFVLKNAHQLKFKPMKGKLGLFDVK